MKNTGDKIETMAVWLRSVLCVSVAALGLTAHADDGRTRVIKAGKLGAVVVRLPAELAPQPALAAVAPAKPAEVVVPVAVVRSSVEVPVAPPVLASAFSADESGAGPVYTGHLACELGQSVVLSADADVPDSFHLRHLGQQYHLRRVSTNTGAVRLEDEGAGAVWLQLRHKSMLLSQKQGRRLVDDCAGPIQRAAAENLRRNPPPHLLDVAQSPR